MARPWMPLYIGDYLRDTQHLTTLQHGAYLLLIMHYWERGELPTDPTELARISRLKKREWESNCLAIAKLFLPGWKHKRIEAELEKHREISEKRAMSGRKGGRLSRGKTNLDRFTVQAFAKQTGQQPQPHIQITSSEYVAGEGESPSVASYRASLARRRAIR